MEGPQNFERMTVPQLKAFLTKRGIPCNGKRKSELESLAKKSVSMYDVIEPCDREESAKKRRRVTGADGSVRDLNDKFVTWKDDLRGLPTITCADVFVFLTVECEWTSQRLKNYKSDDGFRMFVDHHVEMVEVGSIQGEVDFLYIRGKVKPEQRQSAQRYSTWVICSSTGEIKSAGCECVAADAGCCKHVVCLLFSVESFIGARADKGKTSCTDEPCLWNKLRKESHPVPVQNLDYRHVKSAPKKVGVESFSPVRSVNDTMIHDIRTQLLTVCQGEHPTPLLLSMVSNSSAVSTPPSVAQLISDFRHSDEGDILTFLREKTSEEDRVYFQELSQEDPDWLAARQGRITASLAGDVKSLRDQSDGKSLIQSILGTAPSFSSVATDYGKRHEDVARQMYENHMRRQHTKFNCETTGLHISPEEPFLGASPDGIASCKCHGNRVVEIKCPSKHRNVRVVDIPTLDPSYHFQCQNGQLKLKRSSKWFYQVQFQMGILGLHNCDFVIFTKCGIAIINIDFEDSVYAELKAKATRIFCERIFPLL